MNSTRRDFLTSSAAGFFGLVAHKTLGSSLVRQADTELLYVGTYTDGPPVRTEGIYLVRFDTRTGALQSLGAVNAGPNPSFLAIHPNGRALYAVNEVMEYGGKPTGAITAFAIAADTGQLMRIDEQTTGGGAPCYVSTDKSGRVVLVANYGGGSVAVFPTQTNGGVQPAAQVVQHRGKGPNAERQEGPHAHFIATDPSNRFVLAVDLGVDRVLLYRLDADTSALRHVQGGDAVLKPGAGPRHLVFHPLLPFVFVANELDSTVTTFRFDGERGTLTALANASTLPTGWTGTNYPADIHIAPSGRTLYLSNRGHNSIAVFAVEVNGALTLQQTISTGGDWPRNFTIDPTGWWLLVANQHTGSIEVFAREPQSGKLTQTSQRIAIPAPVCLQFKRPA